MNTTVRRGAVALLLVAAAGCGSSELTSPTPPAPPPPVIPPTGASRTFDFDRELSYPVQHYTKDSRFVLYESGAFALQYYQGGLEYRGTFTEANAVITFEWEGWSAAGPWGATGTLEGKSLTVRYNLVMQLSDFEDAVYLLRE